MKNTTLYKLFLLFVLASMLFSACGAPTPAPPASTQTQPQSSPPDAPAVSLPSTPTAAPTAVPTATLPPETDAGLTALISAAAGAPPLVLAYQPAPGVEAQPAGPVALTFDRPMDRSSVEQAFTLAASDGAAVAGQFAWTSGSVVQFQPTQPLARSSAYQVNLDAAAMDADGIPLNNAFSFRFNTVTPLQVSQVFPAADTTDVDPGARITVMFNRPVVPLSIAEDQSSLPQPLTISPAATGKGEWLNTSVYVFQPDPPLKTGAKYTLTVNQGLQDASGDSSLAQPRRLELHRPRS